MLQEISTSKVVRGKSLRCIVGSFMALCTCLVLGAIGCAIAFKFLAHLGWTILSNNFVIVVAMVFANIVRIRMDNLIAVIREDQHKAVLYEATLLLEESKVAVTSGEHQNYFNRVDHFKETLKNTEKFDQPGHIRVMDQNGSNLDMFTTMDMQAM